MIRLSDILIRHHEVNSFAELLGVVRGLGKEGEILLEFDLKPEYPDTPRDWQTKIEIAFTAWERK